MSYDIAIKVKNIGKCYQVYEKPRDRLLQMLTRGRKQYYKEFWALKDVSFKVKKGQTIGIIGKNGSGKSTLLQIICNTLFPTIGNVYTSGRVAALLELGSGFNPEFTGRENVYMNSTILGASKEEIDDKFDDIATFADIGEFIEKPVKTYSSGMYVRLAFAVISHVNADILVIDEALAVGDAFFTQKCMMRIKKLMDTGVTLLFVSHDINAIKALCSKAILLESGKIYCMGDTNKVVDVYYGNYINNNQKNLHSDNLKSSNTTAVDIDITSIFNNDGFLNRSKFQRIQNGKADFINVQLLDENGLETQKINFGNFGILRMLFRTNVSLSLINVAYHIRDKNGFDIVYSDTVIEECPILNSNEGDYYIIDWKFKMTLKEGDYTIASMLSLPLDTGIGQVEVCDFIPIACQFNMQRGSSSLYGAIHWQNIVHCRLLETSGNNSEKGIEDEAASGIR